MSKNGLRYVKELPPSARESVFDHKALLASLRRDQWLMVTPEQSKKLFMVRCLAGSIQSAVKAGRIKQSLVCKVRHLEKGKPTYFVRGY